MSKHESGGGTVLLAFLAGAISGAAVAWLYAPASGDETRQYLSDKARESRQRALAALACLVAQVLARLVARGRRIQPRHGRSADCACQKRQQDRPATRFMFRHGGISRCVRDRPPHIYMLENRDFHTQVLL